MGIRRRRVRRTTTTASAESEENMFKKVQSVKERPRAFGFRFKERTPRRLNYQAAAAELLATFLFVFTCVGTVMNGVAGVDDQQIAWTFGVTISTLVYCFAHYSGAQINPAVSFALALNVVGAIRDERRRSARRFYHRVRVPRPHDRRLRRSRWFRQRRKQLDPRQLHDCASMVRRSHHDGAAVYRRAPGRDSSSNGSEPRPVRDRHRLRGVHLP